MTKLAIAIPCYNRPQILKENLDNFNKYLADFEAEVFIYDDSTNDDTKKMLEENEFNFLIKYLKNKENLGHDQNCIQVLSQTTAEFIWYIGDAFLIDEKTFTKVYRSLGKDIDGLVAIFSKNSELENKCYHDYNLFYQKLGWYICLTGSTIYAKKNLDKVINDEKHLEYLGTNFIQTGIFLESILKNNVQIKCVFYDREVKKITKKESYWRKNAFEVFGRDWYRFNMMLPEAYENKKIVIKMHDQNTSIFGLRGLISLRSVYKNITLKEYKKYKKEMDVAINNKILFFTICLTPRFICKFIIKNFAKN